MCEELTKGLATVFRALVTGSLVQAWPHRLAAFCTMMAKYQFWPRARFAAAGNMVAFTGRASSPACSFDTVGNTWFLGVFEASGAVAASPDKG